MSRRVARDVALKTLFQLEFGAIEKDTAFANSIEEAGLTGRDLDFARQLVDGVVERQEQINEIISDFAFDWKLERLARVERAVMRMALYELLWVDDVPANVTVNEAVELTKIYSSPEAGRFVNGILGNVLKHLRAMQTKI